MPITWDADMDRKLLLAILKHHSVSVDHAAVAGELSTDGQPCSAMAIQKRIQKIRTMIGNGGSGGDATPKPKTTPAKRGKASDGDTPSKRSKTGKAGKGKTAGVTDDDEEPKQIVKEEVDDEESGL